MVRGTITKYLTRKFIRMAYSVIVALILMILLGVTLRFTWWCYDTEQLTLAAGGFAASVVLLILVGTAVNEAQLQILKRGYTRRVGTFGSSQTFANIVASIAGYHRDNDLGMSSRIEFIYVRRDNGTVGEVYLADIYKCLQLDFGKNSVLSQDDWVKTKRLTRDYWEDMRQVLRDSNVVRVKGNGAYTPLFDPGYAIELIQRHYRH